MPGVLVAEVLRIIPTECVNAYVAADHGLKIVDIRPELPSSYPVAVEVSPEGGVQ